MKSSRSLAANRGAEPDYDVVVAGGGAGGVGAALGASRAGARTCLVEKYGFLGGAATTSLVCGYCGFFQQGQQPVPAVAGAGDLVLEELRRLGVDCRPFYVETSGNWIIVLEPERVKLALDRVLAAHGVDVLLHTQVAAVARTDVRIEAVTLEGVEGRFHVAAEAFVDATGDANLSRLADVAIRTGDGRGRFQKASAPIRVGGISPDVKIDRAAIAAAIETYNPTGKYPVARTNGGAYTRLPGGGEMWWMIIDLPLTDLSSRTFSRAERSMRAMAQEYVDLLRQKVPGFENAYLVQTGPQIGVRESRHPAARCELTADDLLTGRQREDGVARAAWPAEVHGEAGEPIFRSIGGVGYAHVPLDALRAKDVGNLYFAGRVIGADPVAYASVRVMGTAFATGEAAGVASANPGLDGRKVGMRVLELGGIV